MLKKNNNKIKQKLSKNIRTFSFKLKYPKKLKTLNAFKLLTKKIEYKYNKLYRDKKNYLGQQKFIYKTRWNKLFQKRFINKWYSNNESFIITKLKNIKIILQIWNKTKQNFFFKFKKKNYLQLQWEKKFLSLNNKIYVRRKTNIKKYYEKLFEKYNKKNLILNKINKNKSFLHTKKFPFYFIVKRDFSKILLKKYKIEIKSIKFWSIARAYKIVELEKPKTKIFSFIMQRRNQKTGFSHWEKYTIKWLKFFLLKNKTIRFYFNPIRIKKYLLSKKLKYIKTYKRLNILHPKTGKWTTIGLVGNTFARNTAFIKKKILYKIILQFYTKTTYKILKQIKKTTTRKNSIFNTKLSEFFNFFEKRIDISLFRTGLIFDISLARLLIKRGYFQQNHITRRNEHIRITIHDFLSLFHCFRNTIYINLENIYENRTYETFYKIFLTRFYKKPKNNTFSLYFTTIINSLTQMIGKSFWTKNYSATWAFLNKYKMWLPTISTKTLYELQLNILLTTTNNLNKENNNKIIKPLNWLWLKKEESILPQLKVINKLQIYYKKIALRINYISKIFKIIHQQFNKKQKNKPIKFLKPILKDLLIQTGETFVKNLIVNFKYRYAIVLENYNIKRNFLNETGDEKGRIIFFQFRWLINFIE